MKSPLGPGTRADQRGGYPRRAGREPGESRARRTRREEEDTERGGHTLREPDRYGEREREREGERQAVVLGGGGGVSR